MERQGDSCIARIVSLGIRLFLVVVVIVFIYMAYINLFAGTEAAPDWLMKGYFTNKHYKQGGKHTKQKEYELAIHEYEQAIGKEPDNEALVEDSRFNIAYCYEQIAEELEPQTWGEGQEVADAIRKQREAISRAMAIYTDMLNENPKNKKAQMHRDFLLFQEG